VLPDLFAADPDRLARFQRAKVLASTELNQKSSESLCAIVGTGQRTGVG
jgi:hypothetical protein